MGRVTAQEQLIEVAARELVRRHAEHLLAHGPVMVLAFDPCPACGYPIMAGNVVARCVECGWRYRQPTVEPFASRRADP